MEKIRMYNPHWILMNDRINIANARVAHIKIIGGYCEIKNPERRAITRKKTNRRFVRTVSVWLFILI
jgi:hypothetical protein